jgi:hypothetical protein
VAFIVYRVVLVGWLGTICTTGARRNGDALPLLLFAFVGFDLLAGELTGHGTVNGYGWLFAGLCIAAAQPHASSAPAPSVSNAGALRVPEFPNLLR